jgi:cell pole-organizing protein PopZ
MSEPKRDDEPTMEEILASIRKIISEDDPAAEAATDDPLDDPVEDAPLDADSAGDEPEPMELTQMVSASSTFAPNGRRAQSRAKRSRPQGSRAQRSRSGRRPPRRQRSPAAMRRASLRSSSPWFPRAHAFMRN